LSYINVEFDSDIERGNNFKACFLIISREWVILRREKIVSRDNKIIMTFFSTKALDKNMYNDGKRTLTTPENDLSIKTIIN
jgi:hypothetical protein